MAQLTVKLEGTTYRIASVMTIDSLDELPAAEGATVHVVAKAVKVLLVKP